MKSASHIQLVKPSHRLLALFELYLRWYVGRHFHGIRLANAQRFPEHSAGPTILYLNHPSWWDPLTCIFIARRFLPQADHYGPIDAAALRRYKFLVKIGLFPVEIDSTRGAIQFLRTAAAIVSTPNSVLWLTPQGSFTDPRKRPVLLKDGLASLLQRLPQATVVPIAIEYTFWEERLPEVLINCGGPIRHNSGGECKEAIAATLTAALTAAQDELATLSMARQSAHFEALLEGRAGVGIVYDLWQRLRAAARGEKYRAEHRSIHRT